jgi:FAD/FMN-containing dehydrogenase
VTPAAGAAASTAAGTAGAAASVVAPGAPPGAAPRDVRDLAERVRDAAARRQPLRILGARTWLGAGRPVADGAEPLDAGALSGIVEYVPGDLTLTARAGTPLADIARVTAAERQWLALDPVGDPAGTLGATVATASAGPLAHAFGAPRDNVLGLEAVTGAGDVVRGGGRVVKNVAGFDLVRLFTGAWGTLGALTEVTVRLRALPAADETVAVELPHDANLVRQLLAGLVRAQLAPWAMEAVSASLGGRLGLGDRPMLLVRLAGSPALVRAQHELLSTRGATELVTDDVWARLRASDPPHSAVLRWSQRPVLFAETWAHAHAVAARTGGWIHASPGRGIVRLVVPLPNTLADDEARELGTALAVPFAGTRIAERLPASLWPTLAPSSVMDRLSLGIRRAFDPNLVLNPGILGEARS